MAKEVVVEGTEGEKLASSDHYKKEITRLKKKDYKLIEQRDKIREERAANSEEMGENIRLLELALAAETAPAGETKVEIGQAVDESEGRKN
jgi:hypothetical protein